MSTCRTQQTASLGTDETWQSSAKVQAFEKSTSSPVPQPSADTGLKISSTKARSCFLKHPDLLETSYVEGLRIAQKTLGRHEIFYRRDDITMVKIRDTALLDVSKFWPQDLSDWKIEGWASDNCRQRKYSSG